MAENLALSCIVCNKHKGTDLTSIDPEDGSLVRLFNPRSDRWADHFRDENGEILARSAIGRVTARLLQVNATARRLERDILLADGLIAFPGE